jgi:hypothetical protein
MLRKLFVFVFLLLAASDTAFARDDAVLWLARCMVNEADFDATADHLAIAAVLIKRATKYHVSMANMVQKYCSGLRPGQRRSSRQRWVIELNFDATKPPHWPAVVPWRWYRERWQRVLTTARLVLRGEMDDPCDGRAEHFGGKMDAPDKSFIRIDCGDTRNLFYAYRGRE